jgi:hypothetical protein
MSGPIQTGANPVAHVLHREWTRTKAWRAKKGITNERFQRFCDMRLSLLGSGSKEPRTSRRGEG